MSGHRPGTSRNRPATSSNRQRPPTASQRGQTRGTTAGESADARYDEEEDLQEQWDEESDEEDVFAYLPPSIGPAPTVVVSEDPQPFGNNADATQPGPGGSQSGDYYLDEATGTVYDGQGRPVDPATLQQRPTSVGTMEVVHSAPNTANNQPNNTTAPHAAMTSRADPRLSYDRKSSDTSSYSAPLAHASSYSAYSPHDPNVRMRNNRLSMGADGPLSPDSELKFNLDADPLTQHKLMRYSSDLDSHSMGMGMGLAHGIDYETAEVGPRGIKMVELEMEGDEDSPYPEVRASVSNVDDTDMPANTVRMWIIALLLTTLGGGINQILVLRYPAPTLTPLIVQVVSYPLGKLFAAILPYRSFDMPRWLGGGSWSLNPGMFNIKEHTAIVIMANVGLVQMYALNAVVALDSPYYYGAAKPIGFSLLLTISSQLFAVAVAGLTRKFLVRPGSMIWPQVLVFCTVFNTLHAEDDAQDGSVSRFKYFVGLSLAAFVWWFLPGWLFTALSSFGFLCWIWPNSYTVNTLFGTTSGLGMTFLTFDWQLISYQTSPLVTPWWAQCNLFIGFVLFLWIVAPILYWTNVYNFSYLPFNSSRAFDRFGEPYNVKSVFDPVTGGIDMTAYESYSRLYLGTTYYIVFWTGMATMTSVLVHTTLYHGSAILRGLRGVQTEEDDIHAKMMRRYNEAPYWWYGIVGVLSIVLAIICAEVYDTGLPVWALLIALIIPIVYYLPSGFIYALTGTQIGVNLVSELVAGYALPSKSLPNMMVKLYSQVGLTQGFLCSQNLKLGHYMKVSPRLTFWVMLIGTVWASVVQVFVNLFMRTHVNEICSAENAHQFTCPQASVYYTSSIIWGVIGPRRMFNSGYYSSIYWALLVGALVPIPIFFASRRWPNSVLKVVNVPLFFTSTSLIPPAAGIVVSSWFAVGFVFQYVIRKKAFRWWSRYNFITSAAMDTGTILSSIIVFLALVLPRDGQIFLHWWGNDITGRTLDATEGARLNMPPENGFAPAPNGL
ncbi:OPT-domain-containing protein [Jaminaea rosea]|uniref:OPT-domain-containing protein n=1 Tax=Jaminaea rosea TaxID=1569628 RepID=A0A316URG7_9BASI|nr:OPT-domain-containing protein [Jaminaea rosea]PWN27910.1 OPT-domain-containing protein [Jaminaea rosea]